MRSSNRKSRQQCPCPGSCNKILVSGARNDCWHSRSFDQSAHSFWMPGGGGPQSSYRAATTSPTSDEGDPELRVLNMEQTTLTALQSRKTRLLHSLKKSRFPAMLCAVNVFQRKPSTDSRQAVAMTCRQCAHEALRQASHTQLETRLEAVVKDPQSCAAVASLSVAHAPRRIEGNKTQAALLDKILC